MQFCSLECEMIAVIFFFFQKILFPIVETCRFYICFSLFVLETKN